MAKNKKFRLIEVILSVICVVFVAEAAAPAAAIGNSQFFWWIFLIIAFLLPYGLIVAELGTTYEDEGGLYDWVRRAFGDRWGSRVSWYYWVNFPLWMASLSFFFPDIIMLLTGTEISMFWSVVIQLAFVWIVVFLSFSRVSDSKWILNLSAVLKVIIALALGGLGISHVVSNGFAVSMEASSFLPTFDVSGLTYLSIILFNFMGFEVVTTYARSMQNPQRQIPLAIIVGGIAIAAIYLFSSFGIGAAIPANEVSLDSGIMDAMAIMTGDGSLLVAIIGVVFLLTLFGNMLSWSFGVNFVAEYAAKKKNMPKPYAIENKKTEMPNGASVINGIVASVLILAHPIMAAVGLENFFWLFFSMSICFLLISYVPMFPAFMKLRKADPNANRIFKVPGGKGLIAVLSWLPSILLIAGIIATIVPLDGSEEELSKLPMLIGFFSIVIIGEVVRIVSARGRKEEYCGMAKSGAPETWDVAHGYIEPPEETEDEEALEEATEDGNEEVTVKEPLS